EAGGVPRTDLTAYTLRQLQALQDPALNARVAAGWGEVRPTARDKAAQIARWQSALSPEVLATADPYAGRRIYRQLCAACHRLFDEGGAIGPDLTGAQRSNLRYLLENIIDP